MGRDDSFFELGGHSLAAMRLIARVEDRFSSGLSFAALFGGLSTVARLAARIDADPYPVVFDYELPAHDPLPAAVAAAWKAGRPRTATGWRRDRDADRDGDADDLQSPGAIARALRSYIAAARTGDRDPSFLIVDQSTDPPGTGPAATADREAARLGPLRPSRE